GTRKAHVDTPGSARGRDPTLRATGFYRPRHARSPPKNHPGPLRANCHRAWSESPHWMPAGIQAAAEPAGRGCEDADAAVVEARFELRSRSVVRAARFAAPAPTRCLPTAAGTVKALVT